MTTIFLLPVAGAFELQTLSNGAELHWGTMPVTWAWVDDGAPALPGLAEAVDASFAAWAEIDGAYVSVEERATALAPTIALDDENLVFFTADWPPGNEALAITTTWTDDDGAIVQYDIYVNTSVAWSTTGDPKAYDVQAALTHEVGHVLGLGHSTVADATMFAKHEPADVHRRDLHADDEDGARYLYDEPPPLAGDSGAPGDDEADGLCATGPASPASAGLLGLTLLGIARRRSR